MHFQEQSDLKLQ